MCKQVFLILVLLICCGLVLSQCAEGADNDPVYKGKTLSEWVKQTKDKSANSRAEAATALGGISNKAAIQALIECWRDENGIVRRNAAFALKKIGKPAVPALIKTMLGHKVAKCRQNAARTLGMIGDKSAVPSLGKALENDKDEGVRVNASYALSFIFTDRKLVPVLIKALNDKRKSVRFNALSGLEKITGHKFGDDIEQWCSWWKRAGKKEIAPLDEKTLKKYIAQLKDKTPKLRAKAAFTLGAKRIKSAVPALIDALNEKDVAVLQYVIHALGNIGDKSAVPALFNMPANKDRKIRLSVIVAFAKLKARSAVPLFLKASQDKDKEIRTYAIIALCQINDKTAVPVLIKAMKHENAKIRGSVATALGEIGDKSAVPALVDALKDDVYIVRGIAAGVLGDMGDESVVPALIDAMDDENALVRNQILGTLRHLTGQKFGQDADKWRTWWQNTKGAAEKIKRYKKKPVKEWLAQLHDENKARRVEAVEALGLIGDKSLVPALIKEAVIDDEGRSIRQE